MTDQELADDIAYAVDWEHDRLTLRAVTE
jgi:hypothetical protein